MGVNSPILPPSFCIFIPVKQLKLSPLYDFEIRLRMNDFPLLCDNHIHVVF
jgi:hypothetical protein